MKTLKRLWEWAINSTVWSRLIVALCCLHLARIGNTGTEKDYLFIIACLLIAFHVWPS